MEFIGLRAKLYCFNSSNQEIKKAKGVKKKVIERDIKMEEYKRALFNKEIIYKRMKNDDTIQSKISMLYLFIYYTLK